MDFSRLYHFPDIATRASHKVLPSLTRLASEPFVWACGRCELAAGELTSSTCPN